MIATGNNRNYPVFNAGDDIPIGKKFVMSDDRLTVLEVCPVNPSRLNGGIGYYCTKCNFVGICGVDDVDVHPRCDNYNRSDHQFVYFPKVKDLRNDCNRKQTETLGLLRR